MSSLFSIGDDELDLDDEDCLLAACDLGSSMNSITDNCKKISDSELNHSSSATQVLRTKKLPSSYERRPFESISNINTSDRANDKKRISPEQVRVHKSSSFTNCSTNSRTSQSITNGLNMPVTKRFAIDNTCNSPSNSANRGNLLRSSSMPGFSNPGGKAMTHSSPRTHPCNNSSPGDVQRNSCTRDLQIRELLQCSFTPSMSCGSSIREGHSNSISIPSRSDPTSSSRPLPGKELSKTTNSSNTASSHGNSAVWQQKQPLMGSPVINAQTGNFPKLTGNTNTVSHDKTERQLANTFNKNKIRTRDLETARASRQSANMGPRTPQGYQAVTLCVNRQGSGTGPGTPQAYQAVTSSVNRQGSGTGPSTPQTYQTVTPGVNRHSSGTGPRTPQDYKATTPTVNKSHARTPSSSRTPKTRKFPGPAGLLPKLSPGQNLEDASFASPLPTSRKPSPVQSKVSQSSASEDEDFNRDPWTYMYQDFVKNVPLAMRYTIIRVYTEAIQQTLDHGKVPCLCALVKAVSLTEADASVLLKDPTGEIHGTLHRKVLENYQAELAPGAGLILKHVSVFSPAPRKHYLNITPGNILQIYPSDPQNITSSQALASQCTQVERKRREQRDAIENEEHMSESVDHNERQNMSAAAATEEELWNQKDCFEDLLEGLDDDEDFLDEALLV